MSIVARFLKDDGQLSMGARGINAPHMTPLDAARLTIALLATEKPARVKELTRIFCDLSVNHKYVIGPAPAFASDVERSASLEDVLAEFFEANSQAFWDISELELCEETQQAVIKLEGKLDLEALRNGVRPPERSVTFDGSYESQKTLMADESYWGRRTKRSLPKSALITVSSALRKGME